MEMSMVDRKLLKIFFDREKEWISYISLNDIINLTILKNKLLLYMKENRLEKNPSFITFLLVVEDELVKQQKEQELMNYSEKLNSIPLRSITIKEQITDNDVVLQWINEANQQEIVTTHKVI